MCNDQQRLSGPEPGEEAPQWQLHLRRGIVAKRMQGRRRRRALVVRMVVLLAIVLWVLIWWYLNN